MKLTTTQVAEKLKVSGSRVLALVKAKKLTDLRASENGRHSLQFDSKEVNAFRKTYVPKGGIHKRKKMKGEIKMPFTNLTARLETIET